MRILITGANGFLGKNLKQHLLERKNLKILTFTSDDNLATLPLILMKVDFIFHLAGVNRSETSSNFFSGNAHLTQVLCNAIRNEVDATGREIGLIFTSSIQAEFNNDYGLSKKAAEDILLSLKSTKNLSIYIFRLPNVFGKWSKPNYNSVASTFCHNIAHNLPIEISDPNKLITLVYVDDVVKAFVKLMDDFFNKDSHDSSALEKITEDFFSVKKQFTITLGKLALSIQSFRDSRKSLLTERVGTDFLKALYATYISYLPKQSFSYDLLSHTDERGAFVEFIKTPDCGQISIFTALPGYIRGSHYHHSKTEKFLVIRGRAKFKFKDVQSGETHEIVINGDKAEVVETVPGWAHEIENIGTDELVVVLWSNEIFDSENPDTFPYDL